MKQRVTIAVFGLFFAALAFLPLQTVFAQEGSGNGLRVSPVRTDVTIEKGSSRQVSIFVENVTGAPVNLRAVVNDFVANQQENGEPRLILDENEQAPGNSFKKLVGSIDNFSLTPGERRELKFTLTVPDNAPAGGYYGAIRFAPDNVTDSDKVTLAASVGSLFLVRVPGDITEQLTVENMTITKNNKSPALGKFFTGSPDKIAVRFKNSGNIHLQPFGKVTVKKGSTIVKSYEINNTDPRGSVLPDTTRKFEDGVSGIGNFGKYTVEGNFGYGESGQLITASKTYYVVPVALIAVFVILLLLVAAAVIYLVRRKKRA